MSYQEEENALQELLNKGDIDDEEYKKRHELLVLKANPEYVEDSNPTRFKDRIINGLKKYMCLRGRSSFKNWFIFLIVFLLLEFIVLGLGIYQNRAWFNSVFPKMLENTSFNLASIWALICDAYSHTTLPNRISEILHIILLIPLWSFSIRRLHDSGRSGTMVIRGYLMAAACWVAAFFMESCIQAIPNMVPIAMKLCIYAKWGLWLMMAYLLCHPIAWLFAKGTDGSNQYGPQN